MAVTLTIITPAWIVYTEHWLRREGYAPRRLWRVDANETAR